MVKFSDALHRKLGSRVLPWGLIPFIFLLVLISLNACSGHGENQTGRAGQKPNIILLLTDDMGYGDLTCYGSHAVYTPHLDELARSGVRYTRFYSASAVCSPSRAAILTGRYPLRFDIKGHFSDREEHLPEGTLTLAGLLKDAGYATAHVGKWHLGGIRTLDYTARQKGQPANPGPLQHGFDHYLCNIEGNPPRPALVREKKLYREGGKHMIRNDKRAPEDPGHWTDIKVNEAIALLEEWKAHDQLFFLNLWFDVPHTPYEPAPEPHLSRYRKTGVSGNQLYFRSMVSHLDANIGRLTAKLKELDLYRNTLIIFTSDNGAAWEGEVGPFKGGKTDLHEGGIRVPFFAVYPGRIPSGKVSFQCGHHIDIFPTICEAAGVPYDRDALDGISLLPNLLEGEDIEREVLFWQLNKYGRLQRHYPRPEPHATTVAYRGPWKLLLDSIRPVELIHLENDPHEMNNLVNEQPEIVRELSEAAERFLAAPRSGYQ